MKPGDVAMLVSFSDRAQVEQPFTDNRRLLRDRLAAIQPTQRTSDIGEALQVAGGLANPGRSGEDPSDAASAEALPAALFLLTDGGFRNAPDFAMGNLQPTYVPFGRSSAVNAAIQAFRVELHPQQPGKMQAFARLENYTDQDRRIELALYLDDLPIDAAEVEVPAAGSGGVQFDLDSVERGRLRLEIQGDDDLALDDVAYAVVNPLRRAKVLLVSPHSDALTLVLGTDEALKIAEVSTATPDVLTTEAYNDQARSGAYDLIIFDRCGPAEMPQANTLTLGHLPPATGWQAGQARMAPQIIDIDQAHPLMQLMEMGDLRWIVQAVPLQAPAGGDVLIDSDVGPLLAIAPREGFEDAVLGFEIFGTDEQGRWVANTDWPIKTSFPLFFRNVLVHLGRSRTVESLDSIQAGQQIALRSSRSVEHIRVESPGGGIQQVSRGPQNTFVYGGTDQLGIYRVHDGPAREDTRQFAVNLFDSTESNIRPRPLIRTRYENIPAQATWDTKRREAWRWLVWGAFGRSAAGMARLQPSRPHLNDFARFCNTSPKRKRGHAAKNWPVWAVGPRLRFGLVLPDQRVITKSHLGAAQR